MYIRKQIESEVRLVEQYFAKGMITEEERNEMKSGLLNFNRVHKGDSPYNFNLHFVFWTKEHIYDVIYNKNKNL